MLNGLLYVDSMLVRSAECVALGDINVNTQQLVSTLIRRGRHWRDRLVILRRGKQDYSSENPTQDQQGWNPGRMHDSRGSQVY